MKPPKHSAHLAAFSLIGMTMTLAVWLTLGLRFDWETSPAWHFAPYLTMLACPLAGISITGMFPVFQWMKQLRILPMSMPFLSLAVIIAWSWVHQGPYESLRDERIMAMTLGAAGIGGMGIGALGILQAVFMLTLMAGRDLGWQWTSRWESRFSELWNLHPRQSPDAHSLEEKETNQERPGKGE